MNDRYSLVFALPLLLIALIIFFSDFDISKSGGASSSMHTKTVNAVIGDESYIITYRKKPTKNTPDQKRIRTHLKYVEYLLRSQPVYDLSAEQQKNRAHNLDLLHQYIEAGNFPHNDGHPDQRRPVFMDEDGNICAVGYLLEQTAGHEMVERINKKYKYAFIKQVASPAFDRWAKKSGFTKRELAMIQPAYGDYNPDPEKENKNKLKTGYAVGSGALLAANATYLSNDAQNPWLFKTSKINHVFGLAAGTGSVLLGALNLDNKTHKEPIVYYDYCPNCEYYASYSSNNYTQTNHLRAAVSIANIGVGLVSMVRAAYFLLQPSKQAPKRQTDTQLNVTHLRTGALSVNNSVPAMQFRYNF